MTYLECAQLINDPNFRSRVGTAIRVWTLGVPEMRDDGPLLAAKKQFGLRLLTEHDSVLSQLIGYVVLALNKLKLDGNCADEELQAVVNGLIGTYIEQRATLQ